MKKCNTCHELKSLSEYHKSANTKDKLAYLCKSCAKIKRRANYLKNRDREQIAIRRWAENNKDRVRTNYLRKYGITQEDYNLMRATQNNSCAICYRHEETIPIGTANNHATCLAVDPLP